MPPSPDAAAARPMGKTGVVRRPGGAGRPGGGDPRARPGGAGPGARRASGHRAAGGPRRRCRRTPRPTCSLEHHALGARRLSADDLRAVLGPLLADPRVEKDAHDAKALSLLLLGLGLELRGLGADVELLSLSPQRLPARARAGGPRPGAAPPRAPGALRRRGGAPGGQRARRPASGGGGRGVRAAGAGGGAARPGPVAGHRVGPADRARPRAGAAAGPGADPDGAPRHQGGPGGAGRAVARRGRAVPQLRRRSCTRWPAGCSTSTATPSWRRCSTPTSRCRSSRRERPGPSTDAEVLEKLAEKHPLPRALLEYRTLSKLKIDVPRRARPAGGRRRAAAHHLPPGGHRDRPAVQLGPEPPEHPGAHRDGPGHPPGLRGRAGVEAGLGGLQPDRAAHPGARRPRTRACSRRSRPTRTCTSAPRPRCSG